MSVDKMLKRPYFIELYNPKWVLEFETIKEHIVSVFGEKALSVDHVGSTSVPGMNAKHCIDILVVVAEMDSFLAEKKEMEQGGYKWEDNYINPETIIFWKEDETQRKMMNIHVCEKGSPDEEQFIVGRDYLRAHPERVDAYNHLKQILNAQHPDDYPAYRAGKQAFLKETKVLALQWKDSLWNK